MKHIASFSGGKDSTAMVLRLIEEDWPLDKIVFFDTGWEFPQMLEHIDRFEEFIGRPITILHSPRSFKHWMLDREITSRKDRPEIGIKKGEVYRIGNGWPSPLRRWCTRQKIDTIDKYCGKEAVHYIGFAADECRRTESKSLKQKRDTIRYPLIEWGMSETDCLTYCRDRGFDWGGLYDHFARVSCFCCPFQRIGELRKLRRHYPDLWKKMLGWEDEMGEGTNRGFKGYKTVHNFDARFANEDCQMRIPIDGLPKVGPVSDEASEEGAEK